MSEGFTTTRRSRTPRQDANHLKAAAILAEAEAIARQLTKAPANGPQKYKGNGNHAWECARDEAGSAGHTERLRVPGGWLYRVYNDTGTSDSVVFVPLPAALGYAI